MDSRKGFFVLILLGVLCIKPSSSDIADADDAADGEEVFAMDLQEVGLTLADENEFVSQYGQYGRSLLPALRVSPVAPAQKVNEKDLSSAAADKDDDKSDDLVWPSDYGLSRHKRQTQDSNDPMYSGQDNPCDTNATLCNGTGQRCEFDSNTQQGYTCQCQPGFDQQNGTCVAIPASRRRYIVTSLNYPYRNDYASLSSSLALQLIANVEAAMSQDFSGLEAFLHIVVVEFRNLENNTVIVSSIYYSVDVDATMGMALGQRFLFLENRGFVVINNQQYQFVENISANIDFAGTQTLSADDGIDWCGMASLFQCPEDRNCLDGTARTRYTCVCRTGFVEVQGQCINDPCYNSTLCNGTGERCVFDIGWPQNYTCECEPGLYPHPNGTCVDDPCVNGTVCNGTGLKCLIDWETTQGYTCQCLPGLYLLENGTCVDDPCFNSTLCNGTGERCVFDSGRPQSYICKCEPDFYLHPNGTCVDDPCFNSTLCNDTGQRCVFDSDTPQGYICKCELGFYPHPNGTCFVIPATRKLYLSVVLEAQFTPPYSNVSSAESVQLASGFTAAISVDLTGLEGYNTVQVVEFRNDDNDTKIVSCIYYSADVTSAMTVALAHRVIAIENRGFFNISGQKHPLAGQIGVFHDLADTQNVSASDAVDWCATATLFQCPEDRKCIDGTALVRYTCVCRVGFVNVSGQCISENRAQPALYSYGASVGDTRMKNSDDKFVKVRIPSGFPVGSKQHKKIFIGTNGFVSFTEKTRGTHFLASSDMYLLCPLFTDIDAREYGDIFYQLYENQEKAPDVFKKAEVEMMEFKNISEYVATKVLVITWNSVPHYYSKDKATERVTVQAALVFNETSTSAVVFYQTGNMNWKYIPGAPLIVGAFRGPGFKPIKEIFSNTLESFTRLDTILGNIGRYGTFYYELGQSQSSDQLCEAWHNKNVKRREDYNFLTNFVLPQCPCTSDGLNRMWFLYRRFWVGDQLYFCYQMSLLMSFIFSGVSKECCYRPIGRKLALIREPPLAGGFLTVSPFFSGGRYYRENVYMHDICCWKASTGYCELYYDVRPMGFCTFRPPFRLARLLGDPHIKTMDGKDYTFNGWGEYLVLGVPVNNTFTLQGRTDRTTTDNGTVINATVFTAFAATDGDVLATVDLDPTLTSMIIYVDGQDYTRKFQNDTNFNEMKTRYSVDRENSTVIISFQSGISMSVSVGVKLLNIGVSLPVKLSNESIGLMGNFNDDPDDDFTLPNGTVLSPNASEREIFYSFGELWAITDEESVFQYKRKESAATFRHPDFVPIFLDEASPEQRQAAETLCGGSDKTSCIYDYIATGSRSLATETAQEDEAAEEEEATLKNTAPELSVDKSTITVTPNSTVTLQLNGTDAEDDTVIYFPADTNVGSYQLNSTTGEVTYSVVSPNQNDSLGFYVVDSQGVPSPVKTVAVRFCPSCNDHGTCDFTEIRESLSSQTFVYATCECEPWYDGDDCQLDFDGCAESPCIEGQNCTDVPAEDHRATNVSYNCSACPTGYAESDGKCGDVDECDLDTDDCGHVCTNTEGSYTCSCNKGYRLSTDDRSCEDINECADKTSDCQQICTNTEGSFNCSCEDGYSLEPSNNTCVQDQATQASCASIDCAQECKVIGSTPECFCRSGYAVNATDSSLCDDVDECAKGVCSQKCENKVGSFVCSCYAGSKLGPDGINCEPCPDLTYGDGCANRCECNGHASACDPVTGCVCDPGWGGTNCELDDDECDPPSGICGSGLSQCVNTRGSFRCDCKEGYARTSSNSECTDVDECDEQSGVDTCTSELETCDNTPGSFYCSCVPGYYRSGGNCTDSDECTNGIAECQQVCVNTIGSFNCDCNYGYRLTSDRKTCEKIPGEEVCAAALNCSVGCTLDDNDQPYCFCETGWKLASDKETCIDINECEESIATCSDTCTNVDGSFTCSCPVGKRLENDQQTCSTCELGTYGANCQEKCQCGAGVDRCDPERGCVCKSGWTGTTCEQDVNECAKADVLAACNNQNAECVNFDGGHRCECQTGFEFKNTNGTVVCEDINECDSSPCSQQCENSEGSYRCLCNAGFTLKNGICKDDDECALTSTNLCTQQCINTDGRYRCACDTGFTLDNDGFTCNVNTECANPGVCASTGNGGCAVNSTGAESCFCYTGYELSGNDCVLKMVDWCGQANCNQTCANITQVPYFQCGCNAGFKLGDDKRSCIECVPGRWGSECSSDCTCVTQYTQQCLANNGTCVCQTGRNGSRCEGDINECDSPDLHSCVPNSDCKDTEGGYVCECQQGFFQLNGSCQACDEGFYGDCSTECSCNALNTQSCNKQTGVCTCKPGWTGQNCETDVLECTSSSPVLHNCTEQNMKCQEKAGGFDCVCQTGYVFNGTNTRQCINRDECFDNSHNCNQTCVDTDGGFNCSCAAGFQGDGYNCTECPDGQYGLDCAETCGACNATVAVPGAPCEKVTGACVCQPGWTGRDCMTNIDFCASNPCPPYSSCNDTGANYTCTCDQGFEEQPDGTCNDIDECAVDALHTCNQTCNNFPGTYNCSCLPGYSGNGTYCDEVDECSTNLHNCDQLCNNTDGSFTCSCNSQFILATDNHTCHKLLTLPFGVSINVTISNLTGILSDKNSTAYKRLKDEVQLTLFEKMSIYMISLHAVIVIDMREGSLEADAEAVLNTGKEEDPVASLVKTLATNLPNETFNISGQNGSSELITFNDKTVTTGSDKCSIYQLATPCAANEYCSVNTTSDLPTCLPLSDDDDYKLVIGLSVGVPLFFVTLGAVFVMVYLFRTGKHKPPDGSDDTGSQISAILAHKIPTRGNVFGPWKSAYSPYSPSVGSASSSEENYRQQGRTGNNGRYEHDTSSPWSMGTSSMPGLSKGAGPTNFSWDIFYNQDSSQTPKFTIKRPKVDLGRNPTYDNARGTNH